MTELSLVERLRAADIPFVTVGLDGGYACVSRALLTEAADALAEQAAVREELCGALKAFVKQWEIYLIIEPAAPGNDREFPSITMSRESWERARAAVRLAEDAS